MRRWHTTPFEMCEIKLHVKMPVFIARQWIRHRTANVNEASARYSIMADEFYLPKTDAIKPQSKVNKQGRDGDLPNATKRAMQETLRQSGEMAFQVYEELHTGWPWADTEGDPWLDFDGKPDKPQAHHGEQGMARELARINLPLSTYTEFYWKIDLHNLFHFLRLRADPHAQQEIRDYADAICNYVEAWCPYAYEAFVDYRLKAETFSRLEMEALRGIIMTTSFAHDNVLPYPEGMSRREFAEFSAKLGLGA
jgi:thymidylate synthase (FAD)